MFTAEQIESAASQCGQIVRYRFGRPVISPEMAALLPSPFVERPRAGYVRPGDPEPEECSVIQPGARIGGYVGAAPDPQPRRIEIPAKDMPKPERGYEGEDE